MRRILFLSLLVVGCGGDDSRYPPGSVPSCQSYCERLATSNPSCGQEIEDCPTDCELWARDATDAGCIEILEDVLYCTRDAVEACSSITNECQVAYDRWLDCLDPCDAVASVGEITFAPDCLTTACSAGTELTMSYPGPLPCTSKVTMTCYGGETVGYLPASPGATSGTIELQCSDPSNCGIQSETVAYLSSGGATVANCTP
jgi:hypothetical protein